MPTVRRYASVLGPLLAGLALVGCGSDSTRAASPAETSLSASTRLVDLDHPGRDNALFSLFNEDAGIPRLVLLVSPT